MINNKFEKFEHQTMISPLSLRLIWLLDTSTSMASDGKLEKLNNTIRSLLPTLHQFQEKNPMIRISVQAITFAEDANWHIACPTSIKLLQWNDIISTSGLTDMGKGFKLLTEYLKEVDIKDVLLPPVIVLVSGSQPTDDWIWGLKQLFNHPLGRRALRFAVDISTNADQYVLEHFVYGVDYLSFLYLNNELDLLALKVYSFFYGTLKTIFYRMYRQNVITSSGKKELGLTLLAIEPKEPEKKAKLATFPEILRAVNTNKFKNSESFEIINSGNIISFEVSKRKIS